MKNKLKFLLAVASVSLLTIFATSINVAFGDPTHDPPGTDVAPTFSGVTVTGNAQFDDTIRVDGDATFSNTVDFFGVANFDNNVNLQGTVTNPGGDPIDIYDSVDLDGDLDVTGSGRVDDLYIEGIISNPVGTYLDFRNPLINGNGSDPLTIRDDLDLSGDIFDAAGDQGVAISDPQGLDVHGFIENSTGNLNIKDFVYNSDNAFTIRDDLDLTGNLYYGFLGEGVKMTDPDGMDIQTYLENSTGYLTLQDQVKVNGSLDVQDWILSNVGPLLLNDDVDITGIVDVQNYLVNSDVADPLLIADSVDINGRLDVQAEILNEGASPVYLDDNVDVSGYVYNTIGNFRINDALVVDGSANFLSNADVRGYIRNPGSNYNGRVYVNDSFQVSNDIYVDDINLDDIYADDLWVDDIYAGDITANRIGRFTNYSYPQNVPNGTFYTGATCPYANEIAVSCGIQISNTNLALHEMTIHTSNSCRTAVRNTSGGTISSTFFRAEVMCFDPTRT